MGVRVKKIRDTLITDDFVGEAPMYMNKVNINEHKTPKETEGVRIIEHNYRVVPGDLQTMSFGEK